MFFTTEELSNRLRKEINKSLYVHSLEKKKRRKKYLVYLNNSLLGKYRYLRKLNDKFEEKQNF